MVKVTVHNRGKIKKYNENFMRELGTYRVADAKETKRKLEAEINIYYLTRNLPTNEVRRIFNKFDDYFYLYSSVPDILEKKIFNYIPALFEELKREEKEIDVKKRISFVLENLMENYNNLFKHGIPEYMQNIHDEIEYLRSIHLEAYKNRSEIWDKFISIRKQTVQCMTLLAQIQATQKNGKIIIRKEMANALNKEYTILFSALEDFILTLDVSLLKDSIE